MFVSNKDIIGIKKEIIKNQQLDGKAKGDDFEIYHHTRHYHHLQSIIIYNLLFRQFLNH